MSRRNKMYPFYRVVVRLPAEHPMNHDGIKREGTFYCTSDDLGYIVTTIRAYLGEGASVGFSIDHIQGCHEILTELQKWIGK